jgi:hypothetical protein
VTEPDEHVRWQQYRHALSEAAAAEEMAVVSEVLADPDTAMASSVVVAHVDVRAAALLRESDYVAWASRISDAAKDHPLVVQRVLEWSLYREITIGLPWTAETLVAASDWLQRKVSEDSSSPEALAVLATSGRTRRIRNATFGRN